MTRIFCLVFIYLCLDYCEIRCFFFSCKAIQVNPNLGVEIWALYLFLVEHNFQWQSTLCGPRVARVKQLTNTMLVWEIIIGDLSVMDTSRITNAVIHYITLTIVISWTIFKRVFRNSYLRTELKLPKSSTSIVQKSLLFRPVLKMSIKFLR